MKKVKWIMLILTIASLSLTACSNKDTKQPKDEIASSENTQANETKSGKKDTKVSSDKYDLGDKVLKKDKNIVFIWQPSCPACENELKAIEEIYKDYKDLHFVGLSFVEKEKDLEKAVKDWGLTFDNFVLEKSFLEKYKDKIKSTPTVLYLDRNGKEFKKMEVGNNLSNEKKTAIKQLKAKMSELLK